MFLYLIPAGLALAGGGYTCLRGVEVRAGTVPGRGDWRIRWACWRYKAEVRREGGVWESVGTFAKGEAALAAAAMRLVLPSEATPGASGYVPTRAGGVRTDAGMIRITQGGG